MKTSQIRQHRRLIAKKNSLMLVVACSLCLLTASSCGGNGGGGGGGSQPIATHFAFTAPQNATAGTAFNFTLTALDASNNPVSTFSGTAHFTSTDGQAILPPDSTLANGTGTFSATLKTAGSQTITATDTMTPTVKGVSGSIQVSGFTATGSMAFAREGHTATLLMDSHVLVVGGENPTGPLASAEIYDSASGAFTSTRSMATARVGHTATLLSSGKVVVIGGTDASGVSATAEIYDPASDTFVPTGSMGAARVGHTATRLADGRVLVTGGTGTAGALATAELFDPGTGQFRPVSQLMMATRSNHAAALLPDGKVLIAGGTFSGTALGDLFNPATATFTPTADGGTTFLDLAATSLEDGRVFLAGGWTRVSKCRDYSGAASFALAVLFDNSGASFSVAGDMSTSRAYLPSILLSGGEVLLAGGANVSSKCSRFGTAITTVQPLASAEIFNPGNGTFTPTADMTIARAKHTATLLGDGKVLVVGGIDANQNALASAELFQ